MDENNIMQQLQRLLLQEREHQQAQLHALEERMAATARDAARNAVAEAEATARAAAPETTVYPPAPPQPAYDMPAEPPPMAHAEDLAQWCRTIEFEMEGYPQWTDAQRVHAACLKLIGIARMWLLDHRDAAANNVEGYVSITNLKRYWFLRGLTDRTMAGQLALNQHTTFEALEPSN
ncbi:hypothetical protein SYNPS1DRAFT_21713 [Syncephalis pseudoplumigaleata]|uniref:DUF4939 domain-containing protein n=1 Tax=Syncephalis pseudoplumigaleata TaxID=1712513 RepID=A0A4V1J1X2_9FUNG|nr:hypothetical protein SYNPS1DRAFT_21713 [Syncephalis pseudoplumigaleata]|eukprot:RKP26549.1 hypothetical protein SYNPS1DRAFT_21713 [Syncephalis pseudoplumigaleata]